MIENPAHEISFQDLNLNTYNNTFYIYRKTNNEINYINTKSNHPKTIINAIPAMIEKRINKHYSNKCLFDQAKNDYNNALKKSGYNHEIKYTELDTINKDKRIENESVFGLIHPSANLSKRISEESSSTLLRNTLTRIAISER